MNIEVQAYLTLLHFTGVTLYTILKARHASKKITANFPVIPTVLQWSETKTEISLMYAYIIIMKTLFGPWLFFMAIRHFY